MFSAMHPAADHVTITVRLPLDDRDELHKRAAASHRTMSQEVRRLIAESLATVPEEASA
jgi:plasmid stability protein